jgi:hypothetical protein
VKRVNCQVIGAIYQDPIYISICSSPSDSLSVFVSTMYAGCTKSVRRMYEVCTTCVTTIEVTIEASSVVEDSYRGELNPRPPVLNRGN